MGILDIQQKQQKNTSEQGNTRKPSKRLFVKRDRSYKFIIPSNDFMVDFKSHYVWNKYGRAYIKCLGSECPICKRNEEIKLEHPDEYKDISEYNRPSTRFAILVYDQTEYKYCSNCGTENDKLSKTCWRCEQKLTVEPEPANTFKSLSLSYSQMQLLASSLRDFITEMGVDFGGFYTKMTVTGGEGRRNTYSFTHFPLKEPFVLPKDFTFDKDILLDYSILVLEPDEIVSFLGGESISSILKNRRLKSEDSDAKQKEDKEISEEVEKTVDDAIKSLFGE